MPRPGITKQEVFTAANHLLGQGKDPTIEQIRQLLKTGSNSTIAAHLRDWRATQGETQTLALNEGLPHEMVGMIKGLWDRLNTQADIKTEEVEGQYQVIINELNQELIKYKTNNRRWQKLYDQWQQEKAKLLTDKLTLQQRFDTLLQEQTTLQTTLAVQVEKLQEKQARISELLQLLIQAQTNLEHERTAASDRHAKLQLQIEQQQQEISILKEDVMISHEKSQKISQQLLLSQQTYASFKKYQQELKQTHDNRLQKIVTLEKSCTEQQTIINVLTQQLADAKQALNEIHDHNKLITNEKWQLLQDKAHLEGQLKQRNIA